MVKGRFYFHLKNIFCDRSISVLWFRPLRYTFLSMLLSIFILLCCGSITTCVGDQPTAAVPSNMGGTFLNEISDSFTLPSLLTLSLVSMDNLRQTYVGTLTVGSRVHLNCIFNESLDTELGTGHVVYGLTGKLD